MRWLPALLLAALLVPGVGAQVLEPQPDPVEEARDLVHDCLFSNIPEDCHTDRLYRLRQEATALLQCLVRAGGPPCL